MQFRHEDLSRKNERRLLSGAAQTLSGEQFGGSPGGDITSKPAARYGRRELFLHARIRFFSRLQIMGLPGQRRGGTGRLGDARNGHETRPAIGVFHRVAGQITP